MGYYISLCSVPFYLAVEDIYDRQYRDYADSAGVSIIFILKCVIINFTNNYIFFSSCKILILYIYKKYIIYIQILII